MYIFRSTGLGFHPRFSRSWSARSPTFSPLLPLLIFIVLVSSASLASAASLSLLCLLTLNSSSAQSHNNALIDALGSPVRSAI
ncbi:hypothetical protein H4582DRAFT_1535614 [Lactarius indigo]|nr:hypothetical protein H4582DRAFT_1535614 [Lactarius indigo]